MEDKNIEIKPKKKMWKKVLIYTLLGILTLGILAGGFVLYKYLFPTDKELFFYAIKNSLSDTAESAEPEKFLEKTVVSVDTEGDFTVKKTAEALGSVELISETLKTSNESKKTNISFNFLESELISSEYVKAGDDAYLKIPMLSDDGYIADDYSDILALITGSKEAADIEITDGLDKVTFEEYTKKYIKMLYKNIPGEDFSSQKKGDIKVVTLKSDANRALYDVLKELRDDKEFCNFLYSQESIIVNNFKEKHPYIGSFVSLPDKTEFSEQYVKNIDDFIKNIEDAEITVTLDINKDRRIEKTQISISSGGKLLYKINHSSKETDIEIYSNDKLLVKITSDMVSESTVTNRNTAIIFDVNDFTKEKSENPKIVTLNIATETDTNVTQKITVPKDYIDIRKISDGAKEDITSQASKKFMMMIAGFIASFVG